MSFSVQVKEEIVKQHHNARHCNIAEVAAMISACGKMALPMDGRSVLIFQTENLAIARKYFTLVKKTFNINTDVLVRRNKLGVNRNTYLLRVYGAEAKRIQITAKLSICDRSKEESTLVADSIIMQSTCCKRAFLRGTFLATGSMSNPEKSYHLEFVFLEEEKAKQLIDLMHFFFSGAKIVVRKHYFVVYIKEGTQISDLLNIIEAHNALMRFENIRILKEMRNSVNRQVNCETANINKTVKAASSQIEDINFIIHKIGFEGLSEGLEEIAKLRISYPEASLKELGEQLSPPIGKSGVNHRLKKLSCIADGLRN